MFENSNHLDLLHESRYFQLLTEYIIGVRNMWVLAVIN